MAYHGDPTLAYPHKMPFVGITQFWVRRYSRTRRLVVPEYVFILSKMRIVVSNYLADFFACWLTFWIAKTGVRGQTRRQALLHPWLGRVRSGH